MSNENIIITKDINEVSKIHSNPEYINWKYEYVDGEYRFYSPNYTKEMSDTYLTLEQLEPLLSESGYMFYGHGTGRSGNSEKIVDSIFDGGLRTKDNSLFYTTVGLATLSPEMKEQYKELGLSEPTLEDLKKQLNNWQHLESKKIIIARIPTEYINKYGNRSDLDGEMFGAFYNEKKQENGKVNYYLDSKFILGCYDVDKQAVRLNKNFEKNLSLETVEKLKEGYKKALEKTKTRSNTNMFEPQETIQQDVDFAYDDNNNFDSEKLFFDDDIQKRV